MDENKENTVGSTEESTEEKPAKLIDRKRILPSVLISVSIPLIICLAVPFEIYSNNMQEFFFGIWDFLPLSIAFGVLIAGVILCVLLFIPERLYRILSLIVLSLALLLFVQGTYLNAGINSLVGDNLGSGVPSVASKVINLIIWIVLVGGAAGVSFIRDKRDIVGKVALVLACIVIIAHLMMPVFAIISNTDVFKSKKDKLGSGDGTNVSQFISTKNLTTISSNNNVFYFCIDRFDEYYAEVVYNTEPELFGELDGFTSFQDNISLYGHTFPAVANMLTNYRYDISLFRTQNLNKAYEENTTLKTLHDKGYKINVYGQSYYDYAGAGGLPDYVENISPVFECKVDNPFLVSLDMICLALYRCSPLILKPAYSKINSDRCNSYVSLKDPEGYVNYSSDNIESQELVKHSPFKTIDENVFTFMHFEGCHNANFDNMNGTAQPSEDIVKNMKQSVKECFETIGLYIAALKEIGAYENATIIITGDHAAPGNSDDSGVYSSRLTALFVKPSGSAEGGLKFSSAQVTHENIWPMIIKSENIQTEEDFGVSLFDVDPDKDMVREHVWQTYKKTSLDEYYYEIKGSGKNFDNWELVKTAHADKYLMD